MHNLLKIIAHAGEEHENTVESLAHEYIPGFIAVPVYLLFITMVGYLVWIISGKRRDVVLIVLAGLNLIIGFGFFAISPYTSVLAITMGIVISGMLTFGEITNGDNKKKKK